MSIQLPTASKFSFVARPVPVPGDLRIVWRLAVTLLMLNHSRGKRASLAKLHIINHALRSDVARNRLHSILEHGGSMRNWRTRVEPAFGRAIDHLVGENLASWVQVANRAGLQLTLAGIRSAETITDADDMLVDEKAFIVTTSKAVTEAFVTDLIAVGSAG